MNRRTFLQLGTLSAIAICTKYKLNAKQQPPSQIPVQVIHGWGIDWAIPWGVAQSNVPLLTEVNLLRFGVKE